MSAEDALGLAEDMAVLDAQRSGQNLTRELAEAAPVQQPSSAFGAAIVAIKQRNDAVAKLNWELSAALIKALDHRLALNAGTTVINQLVRELAACKGTEVDDELERARGLRSRAYDDELEEAIGKGQISADVDLNPKKYPWYIPQPEA